MAIKLIQGLVAEWYTPQSQKGEDRPAQFKIEPLNGLEYLHVISNGEGSTDDDGNVKFETNSEGRRAILEKVKGWKNIEADDGTPIQFSQAALRKLPTEQLYELIVQILHISNLAQADEKNLSSPSKSSTNEICLTASDAPGDATATPVTQPRSSNG